jgi:hypothetical protein
MATEELKPRSRRALLAAAAGAAGALAAHAAMPLAAAAADPDDVVKGTDNPTTTPTSITFSGIDGSAFAGRSTGTGTNYGTVGTSTTGAGVVGWSISPPDPSWFQREYTAFTGVFGSAPSNPGVGVLATGVWGDSPDIGVYGSGGYGVYGRGFYGVLGDANSNANSVGVWAWAPTTAQVALQVTGKVKLSRSGRQSMSSGTRTRAVTLAGVTSTSKVFAVLATGEPGRWVRSVIPAAGKFTIYLNTTLTSSAVVSWFVLD